ncbi:MAG: cysteine desulfurase NifS [Deltaproteobacteria bacterium RBG_13_61_14]|nr:MAG: cysteine desulfurase NifS [Deltaproteobacteria bacterium RBG_13_61_14]
MRNVYLDNNATTPIHPEVQEAIKEALPIYGNASSHHSFGQEARERVEDARVKLARLINADPSEIIFTSCGSESNNLVLKGVTCEYVPCKPKDAPGGRHIVTSQIEHPSVKNTANCLEQRGFKITWLPVDPRGLVDPEDLKKAITRQTVLVTVMLGNNEIGTIEPIQELCAIAREHGVFFHTDAVQALGKVQVDVKELEVDFLSLSGHKLYAPKGIGALYMKKGRMICPLFHGGHQEGGLRVGTENTLGIIALGKAAEVARRDMGQEAPRIWALREKLRQGIEKLIPDVRFNGHPEKVLPGTLNVSFLYVEGESILLRLSGKGIAVSTGSACSSGSLEPSHVLLALGLIHEEAHGSIRFSLGRENTEQDVDYVLEVLPGVIADLRKMSPLSRARAG